MYKYDVSSYLKIFKISKEHMLFSTAYLGKAQPSVAAVPEAQVLHRGQCGTGGGEAVCWLTPHPEERGRTQQAHTSHM